MYIDCPFPVSNPWFTNLVIVYCLTLVYSIVPFSPFLEQESKKVSLLYQTTPIRNLMILYCFWTLLVSAVSKEGPFE